MEIISMILNNLPLILSAGAAIGTGYAWVKGADGRNADTASKLTGTALELVNELQEEIKRMKTTIDGLQSHTREQEEQRLKIESNYKTLLSDFRVIENNLDSVKRELSIVEVERDTLTMKVLSLTNEIKLLTKMNVTLLENISQLQGDIEKFRQSNTLLIENNEDDSNIL